MEDAICFDIWGSVHKEAREAATAFFNENSTWDNRLGLVRHVRNAVLGEKSVILASEVSWDRALALTDRGDLFYGVAIFQADFGPRDSNRLPTYSTHKLTYAGCLGCHVCGGRHR